MSHFSELERLKRDNLELRYVLANLSAYLSAGSGDDNTSAEEYDRRIRWGIDNLISTINYKQ